jgi:iron complex transport system substrate-binding protein
VKIVSLLPAATEIVCALGLRDSLVGCSHECDFPEGVVDLPRLTRARVDSQLPSGALDTQVRQALQSGLPLYELHEAALQALAPDVVVTQAACEVCAVSYEQVTQVTRRAVPNVKVVSLEPARLADVIADVEIVARACDVPDRGRDVAGGLRARLAALREKSRRRRPRLAVIEWLEPPMLAAHWVPDVLEAAGAEPVGPAPGAPSPYVTWEEIAALKADALIVAPCGFDLDRTRREAAPFEKTLAGLAPRVQLMDGNAYWNRPGPRLVDAAESVASWLDSLDPAF